MKTPGLDKTVSRSGFRWHTRCGGNVALIDRILALPSMPGSRYRMVPLDEPVVQALRRIPRDQVPDMPDRIIGATALSLGLPLITRDSNLTSSQLLTCVW